MGYFQSGFRELFVASPSGGCEQIQQFVEKIYAFRRSCHVTQMHHMTRGRETIACLQRISAREKPPGAGEGDEEKVRATRCPPRVEVAGWPESSNRSGGTLPVAGARPRRRKTCHAPGTSPLQRFSGPRRSSQRPSAPRRSQDSTRHSMSRTVQRRPTQGTTLARDAAATAGVGPKRSGTGRIKTAMPSCEAFQSADG